MVTAVGLTVTTFVVGVAAGGAVFAVGVAVDVAVGSTRVSIAAAATVVGVAWAPSVLVVDVAVAVADAIAAAMVLVDVAWAVVAMGCCVTPANAEAGVGVAVSATVSCDTKDDASVCDALAWGAVAASCPANIAQPPIVPATDAIAIHFLRPPTWSALLLLLLDAPDRIGDGRSVVLLLLPLPGSYGRIGYFGVILLSLFPDAVYLLAPSEICFSRVTFIACSRYKFRAPRLGDGEVILSNW